MVHWDERDFSVDLPRLFLPLSAHPFIVAYAKSNVCHFGPLAQANPDVRTEHEGERRVPGAGPHGLNIRVHLGSGLRGGLGRALSFLLYHGGVQDQSQDEPGG